MKVYKDDLHKIEERIGSIEKATLKAKNLTHQLFTFAVGEAPVKEAVSIEHVINDSVNFSLSGSNVRCRFTIAEGLYMTEIDAAQISHVINNLVVNAVQAMPDGGIIKVAAKNVKITADKKNHPVQLAAGDYVKISTTDEGEGIPKSLLPKIFDPFVTTKPGGSGLGLAICYSVIQKHGGCIQANSKVGKGTTFDIYLPASPQGVLPRTLEIKVIYGTGNILVLDDEDNVREVTNEMLTALGYDVSLAEDGREAIEMYLKAKSKDRPFDLVLIDLTIPGGMGGKQVIKELIKIDPAIKAVVFSGYSDNLIITDFTKYGFKGVLKKPFSIEELSRVVDEAKNIV